MRVDTFVVTTPVCLVMLYKKIRIVSNIQFLYAKDFQLLSFCFAATDVLCAVDFFLSCSQVKPFLAAYTFFMPAPFSWKLTPPLARHHLRAGFISALHVTPLLLSPVSLVSFSAKLTYTAVCVAIFLGQLRQLGQRLKLIACPHAILHRKPPPPFIRDSNCKKTPFIRKLWATRSGKVARWFSSAIKICSPTQKEMGKNSDHLCLFQSRVSVCSTFAIFSISDSNIQLDLRKKSLPTGQPSDRIWNPFIRNPHL